MRDCQRCREMGGASKGHRGSKGMREAQGGLNREEAVGRPKRTCQQVIAKRCKLIDTKPSKTREGMRQRERGVD